jgi:hypothetical protein
MWDFKKIPGGTPRKHLKSNRGFQRGKKRAAPFKNETEKAYHMKTCGCSVGISYLFLKPYFCYNLL